MAQVKKLCKALKFDIHGMLSGSAQQMLQNLTLLV